MSKTKALKRKTTAFDIVYRVITAIMAVAMYPLFYFLDLVYIQMDHTDIADLWGTITQNSSPELGITYEKISLSRLDDYFALIGSFAGDNTSSFDIWSISVYRPLIFSVGFLAVALVLGLVVLGFAAFSNKVKAITGISAAGLVCTIISYACFSGFASPIISGEVSIAQLLGQESSSILGLLIGWVGDITQLRLEGAFFAVLFLMLAILGWSVAVLIVNSDEEKEKAEKAATRARNKN